MSDSLICNSCDSELETESDYCYKCGEIFVDKISCSRHSELAAKGVCTICGEPFCKKCGHTVNNIFLCNEHDSYEIYEGMARVYGTSDEQELHYLKSCLEAEGLHPFAYSRKATNLHYGGINSSFFKSPNDTNNIIVNEIKLLVPCGEVLEAERIIGEIK